MSDRETLHHADVEGADETVTVGAYRWIHSIRGGKIPGAPSVTLWAGGANSECGCFVELLPAEMGLPEYPRFLANILAALGEATRKAGPVDLAELDDDGLDAYIDDTAAAMNALTDEVVRLAGPHSAAAVTKARREQVGEGAAP